MILDCWHGVMRACVPAAAGRRLACRSTIARTQHQAAWAVPVAKKPSRRRLDKVIDLRPVFLHYVHPDAQYCQQFGVGCRADLRDGTQRLITEDPKRWNLSAFRLPQSPSAQCLLHARVSFRFVLRGSCLP